MLAEFLEQSGIHRVLLDFAGSRSVADLLDCAAKHPGVAARHVLVFLSTRGHDPLHFLPAVILCGHAALAFGNRKSLCSIRQFHLQFGNAGLEVWMPLPNFKGSSSYSDFGRNLIVRQEIVSDERGRFAGLRRPGKRNIRISCAVLCFASHVQTLSYAVIYGNVG